MASLGDLLQRIARSLEEAREQGPADDLRARLGYGPGDEDDYEPAEDVVWEPETEAARTRPSDREPETGPTRTRSIDWEPETVWRPPAARTPAPPTAGLRASGSIRAPASEVAPGVGRSPPAVPRHPRAPSESPLSERIRARLRTPDALREAFVVKEVLDRPLARRRRGPGVR
jgi:hypothetical protein